MTRFDPPHLLLPLTLTAALLAACPGAQDPADGTTAAPATTTSPSTSQDSTDSADSADSAAPTSTGTALPTTGEGTTAGPEGCIPVVLDDAPVTVVGLGAHPSDAEVCFDVPASVLGFTVIGHSEAGHFGFESLVGPYDDAELMDYTLTGTALQISSENVYLSNTDFQSSLALIAVPQRSAAQAMPPAPGPWRLRLGVEKVLMPAPEVELELWLRRVPGDVPDRLNVNVFASAATIDADAAKALVNQAFADFAGLELGVVEVFVLPDAATVVDGALEFAELSVATAGVDPRPALNVIMAADLTTSVFDVLGSTSSLPSPALRHGTPYSALGLEISGDPAFEALVLAHEAGHYAGLLHTSELGLLGTHDALGDTPECADSDDVESCPDKENLMFYAVALIDDPQWKLSPQQQSVIHASALYEGDAPGFGAAPDEALPPPRSQDRSGALRQLSSATLAALVGCGRGQQTPRPSPEEGRTLLRLAAAPGYSLMLRRRALAMAGLATDAAGVALLGQTAQDLAAPRALRLGAVHGLWAAGQRVRVAALADDLDPAVAQVARGLLRR